MCSSKNILILEDDSDMQCIFDLIFSKEGNNVCIVSTEEKAIKKIEENNIDLIIIDSRLPYRYGERLLKFLRTSNLRIKTIFISVYTPQFNRETLSLGSTIFLEKPFTLSELMEISQDVSVGKYVQQTEKII